MAVEFDVQEASGILEIEPVDSGDKAQCMSDVNIYVSFLQCFIVLENLSTVDDVTKYRGIPVSRCIYDGVLSWAIT